MEVDSRRKRKRRVMEGRTEEAPVRNIDNNNRHNKTFMASSWWPALLWLAMSVATTQTIRIRTTVTTGTHTWKKIHFPVALVLVQDRNDAAAAASGGGFSLLRSRRRTHSHSGELLSASGAVPAPQPASASATTTSFSTSFSIQSPQHSRRIESDFDNDDEPPSYFGGGGNENGNRNPFPDQYYGGWVPEKNEHEIDCSQFEDLDELPPLCVQKNHGGQAEPSKGEDRLDTETTEPTSDEGAPIQGGEDGAMTAESTSSDFPYEEDDATPAPTSWEDPFGGVVHAENHSIRVRLSLGIQNHEALTDVRTQAFEQLTHHVIAKVWNRYLEVLEVVIPGQDSDEDEITMYFEMELDAVEWNLEIEGDPPSNDDIALATRSDGLDGQERDSRSNRNSDRRNFSVNGTNLITREADADDSEERELVATLELSHSYVNVQEEWEKWLQLSIEFAVFWPDGNPVYRRRPLRQIQDACQHVVDTAIKAGKFWKELKRDASEHHGENWVLKRNDWGKEPEKAFVAAVAIYGEEFPFESKCPKCPEDTETASMDDSWQRPPGPFQYDHSVNTDWGAREWFGLVMGVFTILFTTLLTVVSVMLQNYQATKAAWGLTEQGVGELLEVGWSYQIEDTGQLYLKVYKKSQLGYSDKDSMLQGEVPISETQKAGT